MRQFGFWVAAFLALAARGPGAHADGLPPEIAARYAEKSQLEAGLPTGPSVYQNWRSPKTAPWSFAYVGSTRFGTWSDAALKAARDDIEPGWERLGLSSRLATPPAAQNDAEASRQIRELADQGTDAILVCCAAPNGIKEAAKYAHEKGSLIVTLFGFSTSPYGLNTTTDLYEAGVNLVKRVSENLNEKGNVLVVGGFLDPSASAVLEHGVRAGFAEHRGLKMVGDLSVKGGSEAARAAIKSWLATHHDPVDAVIVRGGADAGILQVFSDAKRKTPILTISGDNAAVCYWRHNPDFAGEVYLQKAIVAWPPGDAVALAFQVAMRTLQGQGPKVQSILADPLWLSYHDLTEAVPTTCKEDDDGWLYLGRDSLGGVRWLNAYFNKPADPKAYKP